MSSSWAKMTLRNAGVTLIDCEHKTPAAQVSGYPYIAIPQINNGRIETADVRHISHEDLITWTRKAKPQVHDVILSRRCNPGETAFVPPDLVCAIGQNLVLLRSDGRIIYEPFLRWLVRGPEWWDQIEKYLNTGAIFDSLKCADIPNFELTIPSLPIQRRIADILSALDEKIELNRQTNASLEAIAQAIFKEWFVDFNFPGATGELVESELGMIPKGWRVGKIEELCDVNKNVITREDNFDWIDYIEISEVNRGKIANVARYKYGEEPSRAKRKLRHGDTVLSTVRPNRGSFFLSINPPINLIASTGFAVFSPTRTPFSFLYLFLTDKEKLEYYGHVADGAAYPAINPTLIMNMDVVIPENSILSNFHSIAEPILNNILFNEQESQNLSVIRDTLLPKLMSGEIEV